MNRDVITFREDTPIDEVASTLRDRDVTGAPVVADDGSVVGIVSEVDIFTKRGSTAGEIMSPHVISISEDTGIVEAAQILAGERIRRVPVLAGGKMVGILSRSDVFAFFTRTHWSCTACGHWERGLASPETCRHCGGTAFQLEGALPGT